MSREGECGRVCAERILKTFLSSSCLPTYYLTLKGCGTKGRLGTSTAADSSPLTLEFSHIRNGRGGSFDELLRYQPLFPTPPCSLYGAHGLWSWQFQEHIECGRLSERWVLSMQLWGRCMPAKVRLFSDEDDLGTTHVPVSNSTSLMCN